MDGTLAGYLSLHRVEKLEIKPVVFQTTDGIPDPYPVRKIVVYGKDGQDFELTLFGNHQNSLAIGM